MACGIALVTLAGTLAGARSAWAQGGAVVTVVSPQLDSPLTSATPPFTVVAHGLGVPASTVSLELQVSRTPSFDPASIVFDDTLPGDSVDFQPVRPLPSEAVVWWRAIARVNGAVTVTSVVTGPKLLVKWLTLVEPDAPNGVVLDNRRPRFVWTAAEIIAPPGPWRYTIEIAAVGGGDRLVATGISDTTFVPPRELQSNTSYRWAVTAFLPATTDSLRVPSQGSFVISTPDRPLATLLYQNFPNPFPTASSSSTCVWFDLERAAQVQLEVLTLRGDRVRTLYPVGSQSPLLPPGRYGRADVGSNTGCDAKFAWDGRSNDGREVAPGVYLLRLRVADKWETRKVVFRGG